MDTGRSPGARPSMGLSSQSTRPQGAAKNPAMTLRSVDLPAPEGPTMAVMDPSGTSRSASRRKSPCVISRRSSPSIGAASPVEEPEDREAKDQEQERGACRVAHPVRRHQAVEFERQGAAARWREERDDPEIAHRERGGEAQAVSERAEAGFRLGHGGDQGAQEEWQAHQRIDHRRHRQGKGEGVGHGKEQDEEPGAYDEWRDGEGGVTRAFNDGGLATGQAMDGEGDRERSGSRQQARREGDGDGAERGLPDDRRKRDEGRGASGDDHREGDQQEERREGNDEGIERTACGGPGVPSFDGAVEPAAERGEAGEAEREGGGEGRDGELDDGEAGGAVEIEVEGKGLVDGEFDRRGGRAAAEREGDGEARRADEEDDEEGAGKGGAEDRTLDQAVDVAGLETEGSGEAEALGRDFEPALQDQAGGERQVEEDVGEDDAVEAVDLHGRKSEEAQRVAEDARASEDG